jgi:hypothetical protein
MKTFKSILVKIIIPLLQVLIIIPPLLLQYLSDRKMGLMRYLVFKKDVFSKEIFTSSITFAYKSFLLSGIIFCIIFLIYSYTKKIKTSLIKPISALFLYNLLCLFYVFYNSLYYHLIAFLYYNSQYINYYIK